MFDECMKSRNSYLFQLNEKVWFFDNSSQPRTADSELKPSENLNFSSTYWQPFVDMAYHNVSDRYEIAGPFLGLLFEIARYLRFSVTYVGPTEAPWEEYYKNLNDGLIDVFLNPTPPLNMFWWTLLQPSVAFGEVSKFNKI